MVQCQELFCGAMSLWPGQEGSSSAGPRHAHSGRCPVPLRCVGKEQGSGPMAPTCKHTHAHTCVQRGFAGCPEEGSTGHGGRLVSRRAGASPVAALQDAFIIPNRWGGTRCTIFYLGNRQQNGELHLTWLPQAGPAGRSANSSVSEIPSPPDLFYPTQRDPKLSWTASSAGPQWTKVLSKDSPALLGTEAPGAPSKDLPEREGEIWSLAYGSHSSSVLSSIELHTPRLSHGQRSSLQP